MPFGCGVPSVTVIPDKGEQSDTHLDVQVHDVLMMKVVHSLKQLSYT